MTRWGALLVALLLGTALLPAPQTPAPGLSRGGPPAQGAEPDIELVARFDENGDKRLDDAERTAAREYLAAHPELRRPARSGRNTRVGTPGPRLSPKDVRTYPDSVSLYDPAALRTVFLEFDHADWEQELAAFYHTDVQVPATLTLDGRTYRDVGVAFGSPRLEVLTNGAGERRVQRPANVRSMRCPSRYSVDAE